MPAEYATASQLKAMQGLASLSDESAEALILAAQEIIDSYTRSTFIARTATETHDGKGSTHRLIACRHLPVISIESVTADGAVLDADSYVLKTNAFVELVTSRYSNPRLGGESESFVRGTGNIEIALTWGRHLEGDVTSPPAAINRACLLLAAWLQRSDGRTGIKAESFGPVSKTYLDDHAGLPGAVKAILNPYRQRMPRA